MEKVKKLHLPFPSGPQATGCMELMTDYSPEGCFSRIFYPINISPDQLYIYSDKWIPWIPHEMYMKAFAKEFNVPYFLCKYGLPLIGQGPYYIPTVKDAALSDKENSYPLIVFSHGLGATRFICSDLCNNLASYGFIVAAIEHRDESAPITFYYESPEDAKEDKRTWIHKYNFTKTENKSDYYNLRNNQMKVRHKECTQLLDTFLKLNAGISITNVLESSFDLKQFKNTINVENIVSMGFSFGGTTAMYNSAFDKRYQASIIIDGWMFPLKSEPFLNIDHPMLFINSHTFNLPANLNVLQKYIRSKGVRQIFTLLRTTHECHTDTAFMHGYWSDLFMLKKMDPETALNLQNSIAVKFLGDNIGYPRNCDKVRKYVKKHRDDNLVKNAILYTIKTKNSFLRVIWQIIYILIYYCVNTIHSIINIINYKHY